MDGRKQRREAAATVRRQRWLSEVVVGSLPDGSFDARFSFKHALYRHVFYQMGAIVTYQGRLLEGRRWQEVGLAERAQFGEWVAMPMFVVDQSR